jgi:MFS family permease
VATTGWRGAFLLYGVFALVLLLLAAAGVRNKAAPRTEVIADLALARPPGFLKTIAPVCALTTLMGILTVIPMAQLPFVLVENGNGSPQQVSIVLGVNFIFAAISAINFARLKILFGKRATFFVGLTIGMIGIALMGVVSSLTYECVAAALAGFGTGIYNTYVFDHGVEISPSVYHGRAAGLLFAFMFFGAAINPLVAGVFEQIFGLHHAFPAMAIVALLCGLPVILYRPHAPAPASATPGR